MAAPAVAQSQVPANQAPAADQEPKTKLVCQKVAVEQTTGSRLGSTTKLCRTVKVPAEDSAKSSDKAETRAN
ncbi:MAG TPA: hypothetical protein VMK31_03440 [Sphingomicrobium sp.]|nr:hypothetical protein [Sphingomicrobium sp.]